MPKSTTGESVVINQRESIGAASDCKRIDPKTGEVIEVIPRRSLTPEEISTGIVASPPWNRAKKRMKGTEPAK